MGTRTNSEDPLKCNVLCILFVCKLMYLYLNRMLCTLNSEYKDEMPQRVSFH